MSELFGQLDARQVEDSQADLIWLLVGEAQPAIVYGIDFSGASDAGKKLLGCK